MYDRDDDDYYTEDYVNKRPHDSVWPKLPAIS